MAKTAAAKKKPADSTAGEQQQEITLPPINIKSFRLRLVGDSPLIVHKWSEKAKREILDKQMKKAKQAKQAKDPVADFWGSMYILEGEDKIDMSSPEVPAGVKFGFPVVAFKAAAVNACSHVSDITKVLARGVFHIDGEYVEIQGDTPVMREDMVRIAMGTADIRYRGAFENWYVDLDVKYNASVLSADQIVNLFNIAGFAIGVGEWRPQKNGSMGMFHVARSGE